MELSTLQLMAGRLRLDPGEKRDRLLTDTCQDIWTFFFKKVPTSQNMAGYSQNSDK